MMQIQATESLSPLIPRNNSQDLFLREHKKNPPAEAMHRSLPVVEGEYPWAHLLTFEYSFLFPILLLSTRRLFVCPCAEYRCRNATCRVAVYPAHQIPLTQLMSGLQFCAWPLLSNEPFPAILLSVLLLPALLLFVNQENGY